MSAITTHVLDTARGLPAGGVSVRLERWQEGGWTPLGQGVTDADGRCRTLMPEAGTLELGRYRLTFETAAYFESCGVAAFFPEVSIAFEVADRRHHHVPLLLSPFGYSTYRGS